MKGILVFQTVDDILKFAEITNSHVILVAIDFEKAFHPLNDNKLFSFQRVGKIQFWTLFYTSSCIIINGFTTNLFCIFFFICINNIYYNFCSNSKKSSSRELMLFTMHNRQRGDRTKIKTYTHKNKINRNGWTRK